MVFRARLNLIAPFALVLLASPLAAPAFADQGVAAADDDDDDDDDAPKDVASVKIELKQASGKVLKYDGALLEFGADGNVSFKADDHVHDVSLRIDRAGEGKAISLTVGYTKDGQAIITPQTVDSEIKKREVIRIEGGVAIAITVTSKPTKKAAPEEKPEETPDEPAQKPKKKDRIVDPGGNNPLDGVK